MITFGDYNRGRCIRKSDLGFMLDIAGEEVLLHFKQSTRDLKENEIVDVFVFLDNQKRIVATMEEVNITISKPNFVKVIDVNKSLGVFIGSNTYKDFLISKDDLPLSTALWPQVGDEMLCKLVWKNNLIARILTKKDILALAGAMKDYPLGSYVDALIVKIIDDAVMAITKEFTYIYIPQKQMRTTPRLGEAVKVMLIGRHDDEYVGSLNKVKEELIDDDEKMIIAYLEKNKELNLTAKSSTEEVFSYFNMSRKAFKRALGSLYRQQLIEFRDEKTYLVDHK